MPRPTNISITDLMRYQFPVTAISSIFHRVTGVILFIYIPFVLYYLDMTLKSPYGFMAFKECVSHGCGAFFLWLFCSVGVYHFLAGIKHLIMDFGAWESLGSAKVASWGVIVLGLVAAVLLGVWVW